MLIDTIINGGVIIIIALAISFVCDEKTDHPCKKEVRRETKKILKRKGLW